jgi:hypothetical protein
MSTEKSKKVEMLPPTWEAAIDECHSQLRACQARAGELKVCLEYFETRKKSGDPFPGIGKLIERGLVAN